MKNKRLSNLLGVIALLLAAMQIFTGCNDKPVSDLEETESETDSVYEEERELMPLTNNGEALYCVVYDPKGVEGANMLVNQLVAKMTEMTGHEIDFRRYSSNNIASTEGYKHMYVGAVAGYTDGVYRSLKQNDYRVDIIDGEIIFGGYTYEKLYLAVGYFYKALLYKDGELYVDLAKADIGRSSEYLIGDITVGNTPIYEYSIVYGDTYTKAYAEKLSRIIGDAVGYVLPVVDHSTEECDNEIIVGVTNRNPNDKPKANGYSISIDGSKVKLVAGDDVSAEMMAAYLLSKIADTKSAEFLDISSVATEYSGDDTVRMMTFNVKNAWGSDVGARGSQIANMILLNNLDIVCLQEYDTSFRKSGNNLQTLLSSRFAEVTVDGVKSENIWNPIFYNKDKYEVVESGMTDMYAEGVKCYENLGYPDGDGRSHFRSLVWAVLRDKTTNQRFLIGSLHYSASGGDHGAESRLLVSKLADVRARYTDAIVLVAGDYNSTVSNGACSSMINSGYKNTLALAKVRGRNEKDVVIGNDIDNILTVSEESAKITVQGAVALHEGNIINFSDHLPVVIQFKVN